MISAFVAGSLLVTSLLALAARALDELCRLYALPRRWVWAAALCAAIALPAWLALTPAAAGPAPGAAAAPAAVLDPGDLPAAGAFARAAAIAAGIMATVDGAVATLVTAAAGGFGARALDRLLLGAWLLLTAAGALLFGWTAWRLARARRGWPVQWLAATRVHVANRGGPAVIGLFRPAIVVPAWLLHASAERQRLVVLHEREHVRGGDHALLGASLIALLLLPWNAPLHWIVRRLRLAVELDCDRRVLRHGADARAYGSLLIDMAARVQPLPLAAALADSTSDLERRVVALTGPRPRRRLGRAVLAGSCAAVLLLLATRVDPRARTVAAEPAGSAPVADAVRTAGSVDPQAVEPPDAAQGGLRIRPLGSAIGEPAPLFIVDGEIIAEGDVNARVNVDAIERIEVVKGPAAAALYGPRGAGGVIRIATRQ